MPSLPDSDPLEAPRAAPGGSRWSLQDAVPGAVIVHAGGRTIDAAEHVWLAWMTHNVSDIHGNADRAASGAWGEPLVLGMLTAAVVIGLAEPAAGPPATAAAALARGWHHISLEHPVVAGATLTAESHIEHVQPCAGGAAAEVRRTIVGRDQHGRAVVRIAETRVLSADARRPSRPAAR
jgi:acyl dehydratase